MERSLTPWRLVVGGSPAARAGRLLYQSLKGPVPRRKVYDVNFEGTRAERMLIGSLSFFASFALTRGVTHAIKRKIPPFHNISAGGKHIHHMTFGITLLLATGYGWLAQVGTGRPKVRSSRLTALAYGVGAALTLDEFALWLNLEEDDYWNKEGRQSVDAVILFGALLSAGFWGRALARALARRAAGLGRGGWRSRLPGL
jgi:hypothetical protein